MRDDVAHLHLRTVEISDDVFYCIANDHMVFLDLPRNRYLCLGSRDTQILLRLMSKDAQTAMQRFRRIARTSDERRVLHALYSNNLIGNSGLAALSMRSPPLTAPSTSLLQMKTSGDAEAWFGHFLPFLYAAVSASWKLRTYSMQRLVHTVRERRAEKNTRPRRKRQLRALVMAFHQLRPLYFRRYLCLYDSLALLEFLRLFDLHPQWVFGVATKPFSAHCWVQSDDMVLNDAVERVQHYSPIMAV